jgi:hypothetical protein
MQPGHTPTTPQAGAESRQAQTSEHRETILLLTQALAARVSTMANDPPPPGWWFTPPASFSGAETQQRPL